MAETPERTDRTPLHVAGELLASKRAGAFRMLTIAAPGVPERFRAGTFVAISVGEGRLARRPEKTGTPCVLEPITIFRLT